jgi:hypothetical protein
MSAYTVAMHNQTIVADATLVAIHTESTAGARGAIIELLRCWVSQIGTETSDQLGIILGTKVSAFGTYTATTPAPLYIGGNASGITGGTTGAESLAGTDASAEGAGAVTAIITEGFNNVGGWLWVPTPEERIVVPEDHRDARDTDRVVRGDHLPRTDLRSHVQAHPPVQGRPDRSGDRRHLCHLC